MSSHLERERALRFYRFLQDYALVRFPYLRDLEDVRWSLWLEELPQHPSIQVNRLLAEGQEEDPGVYLRVRRPKLSAPPEPPALLREWLEPGWEDPFSEPRLHPERSLPDVDGKSRVVRFEEVRGGKEAWASWLEEWEVWARDERIARRAHDVYEKTYGLYGDLQRESERYELVLGNGILSWSGRWGSLYVPLLLVPVQLEFNPKEPEFIVRDAGKELQLYTAG
ncbi:hypothetical protein [Thermus sp.]|uniref:hypothetical protein n=1 Tax=Thermus sp. TaxID=275 RepID=UPI00307D57CC